MATTDDLSGDTTLPFSAALPLQLDCDDNIRSKESLAESYQGVMGL